jgi:choline dehydrogenase
VLEWALTGKGRIANMPVTANGFIKNAARTGAARRAVPVPADLDPRPPVVPRRQGAAADVVAMACVSCAPKAAAGSGSPRRPAQPPRILTNVLSTENDRAFFRRVIPQMREILATAPLADVVKAS